MIIDFKSKGTQLIFEDCRSSDYPPDIQTIALRKLLILHAAVSINDLRIPPGNRLKKLDGDRKGQYSLRINNQWRICFIWTDEGNAGQVEIVDYHETTSMFQRHNPMNSDRLPNIHPGEILKLDFLEPLEITSYRLSKDLGVSQTRMGEVLAGKRSITADTALRLSRYFGNSAQFWLNLQTHYDLRQAENENAEAYDRIPIAVLSKVS